MAVQGPTIGWHDHSWLELMNAIVGEKNGAEMSAP